MFKLDDELLKELGLGSLPPAEKNKMLAHIYETLEMRVGMRLAQQMTDAQLDEFEAFIDRNDEAGALKWLESNFPDYKQVVADELEKLKAEIKTQAPMIVEATMANVAAVGGAPQPQQPVDPNAYAQPAQPYYPPQSAQQPTAQPQYQQPYQQPQDPYQPQPQPAASPYQQPYAQQPQQPVDPAVYAQPAQPYYPPQSAQQPTAQPQYQQPYQQPHQPAANYQDPYQVPPTTSPGVGTNQQDQQQSSDQAQPQQ